MRMIAILLAIFHGANGLLMLSSPALWYASAPGVAETGPLDVHFVRDTGLGFLAAAAALALFARETDRLLQVVPAAVFLGGHAVLHLAEMAMHGAAVADGARDLLMIVLPGLLPVVLLFRGAPVGKAVRP